MSALDWIFSSVDDLARFDPQGARQIRLIDTETATVFLNYWEPGQTAPEHRHMVSHNAVFVLEGEGDFSVGAEHRHLQAGAVLRVPLATFHGITAGSRMVTLHIYSPKLRMEEVQQRGIGSSPIL